MLTGFASTLCRQNQDRLHAHWATNSQDWNLDSPALAGAHPTYSPWEGPSATFQTPSTPTTSQPNGRSISPSAHLSSGGSYSSGDGSDVSPQHQADPSHRKGSNKNHQSSSSSSSDHRGGWRKGHASRASRELTEMTTNAMACATPTNPYFGQTPFGLQSAGFSLQRPSSSGTVRGSCQ